MHGEGRAGAALVWGGGRATRRGKLGGRGRKCEGRAEAYERGAESAGLGGPGGGGAGGALGDVHTFFCVKRFFSVLEGYKVLVQIRQQMD